eukprot:533279_1
MMIRYFPIICIVINIIHVSSRKRLRREDKTQILTSAEAEWGNWSPWIYCDNEQYAIGFRLAVEPNQRGEDDTGANGFALICSSNSKRGREIIRAPNDAPWGVEEGIKCRKGGKLVGFQTKVQDKQHKGDDTALNSVRSWCLGGSKRGGSIVLNPKGWGKWGRVSKCHGNKHVCGFRQRVDTAHISGLKWDDETGLNAIQLACCGKVDGTDKHSVDVAAPIYIIDVSKPPSEYLKEVCEDFTTFKNGHLSLRVAYNTIMNMLKKLAGSAGAELKRMFLEITRDYIQKGIPEPYLSELKAYMDCAGKQAGISFEQGVMMNLLYEFAYFCTSIVAVDAKGHIIHGRNFDFPEVLKFFTVHFKYINSKKSGNKVLYESVGFFAFVGTPTAFKPHAYGLTMNLRKAFDIWSNIMSIHANELPSSWLFRECLLKDDTYDQCKIRLINTNIMAPGYYIISGPDYTNKGAIIARSPQVGSVGETVQNIQELSKDKWYLAETNFDDWHESKTLQNLFNRFGGKWGKFLTKQVDNRLQIVKELMDEIGQAKITPDKIYEVLSSDGILKDRHSLWASSTVYTTLWSPSMNVINYVNVTLRNKKILKGSKKSNMRK